MFCHLFKSEKFCAATRANGLEFCKFPGFNSVRLTNLPGDREPATILDAVTVAQSFKVTQMS